MNQTDQAVQQRDFEGSPGDIVFYSGDAFESPTAVKVTEENYDLVCLCWNRLYFGSIKKAEERNSIAKARYGEYQAEPFLFCF